MQLHNLAYGNVNPTVVNRSMFAMLRIWSERFNFKRSIIAQLIPLSFHSHWKQCTYLNPAQHKMPGYISSILQVGSSLGRIGIRLETKEKLHPWPTEYFTFLCDTVLLLSSLSKIISCDNYDISFSFFFVAQPACNSGPCLNGGLCTNTVSGGFICNCLNTGGYSGNRCEFPPSKSFCLSVCMSFFNVKWRYQHQLFIKASADWMEQTELLASFLQLSCLYKLASGDLLVPR